MTRLEIMNKRQAEAVEAFIANDGIGTVMMPMGAGKSFIFFKVLYTMLEMGWLGGGDSVFFWAETNIRELNMRKEAKKFNQIFSRDPHADFNITYHTYQSRDTGERILDCYDEIDWAITSEYSKVLATGATYRLGLTATNQASNTVYRDKVSKFSEEMLNKVRQSDYATEQGKVTEFINKGQLLKILCPIIYEYSFEKAIEEGVISPFETIVIEHALDNEKRDLKKWKTYDTICTEGEWYSGREYQRTNYRRPKYLRAKAGKDQAKFLWELPSKAEVIKRLLNKITGKTVLFSVNNALLYMVTENVVTNATKTGFNIGGKYFSKKKGKYMMRDIATLKENKLSEELYDTAWESFKDNYIEDTELIRRFDAGQIDLIATSKKISRGITLDGVENCILMSYYSTNTHFLQQLGRVLRFSPDKIARLFIIKTVGTREEKWFEKLPKVYDDKGKVVNTIDLNIIKTVKSYQL